MELSWTPNKGKKGVEAELLRETVAKPPLRYDHSQERTVEGMPYNWSFLRSSE